MRRSSWYALLFVAVIGWGIAWAISVALVSMVGWLGILIIGLIIELPLRVGLTRLREGGPMSGFGASVSSHAVYRMAGSPHELAAIDRVFEGRRGFLGRTNCATQPVRRYVFSVAKFEGGGQRISAKEHI